jgi:hypothetical protein
MQITLADIKAFLATEPTPGEVNSLIAELKEYQSKQKEADRVWKRQLPFANWGDLNRRQQFRDILLQLHSQRISVSYKADLSKDEQQRWRLRRGKDYAGLTWDRETDQWTVYGFPLVDSYGNNLPAFSHVKYAAFCPW